MLSGFLCYDFIISIGSGQDLIFIIILTDFDQNFFINERFLFDCVLVVASWWSYLNK